MNDERKKAFLARLMYELTLAGRSSYSIESPGLDQPTLLREINELQHKVSSQLMNTLSGGAYLRSSASLAALFLDSNCENEFHRREFRRAFIDALAAMIPQGNEE